MTANSLLDLLLQGAWLGVAAFLGAYLAQKGKNWATKEDIAKLLRQAQAESDAKKQGELDAIQRNFQMVLSQLAETTALAKKIESDFSYDVWDRQMRWTFKKDLYVRLLETLGQRVQILNRLHLLANSQTLHDLKEKERLLELNTELMHELQKVASVAGIALSKKTTDKLDWLSSQMQAAGDARGLEVLRIELNLLREAFDAIAAIAKEDVGLIQ